MNNQKTQKIVKLGIIISIEIVLMLISTNIRIGTANFNLALIPICIAACLYGPIEGMIIGIVNGIITLFGAQFYLSLNFIGTIILCICKTGIAGLVSGLVFKALKKNKFAVFISSGLVPIINTFIFLLGVSTIYYSYYVIKANGSIVLIYVMIMEIGINFFIEILISIILAPSIYSLIKISKRR